MTREETIKALSILKEQALKSHNDTAVIDVKKDSFVFVIQSAIEILEKGDNAFSELQEIRQEIANLAIAVVDDNYVRNSAGLYCVKREIIEIIDKHMYQTESEDSVFDNRKTT